MSLLNYEFVVVQGKEEKIVNNRIIHRRVINIGLKDKAKDIVYPHPLTNILRILFELEGCSLNTLLPPARTLCKFMNYIFLMIESDDNDFSSLRESGLHGLKLVHGTRYLSSLSERGIKKATVKNQEQYLKQFFYCLHEQGLITTEITIHKYLNQYGRMLIESPFEHPTLKPEYPHKDAENKRSTKLKDFGENRWQLVVEFIQKAREVAPEIAFGLCLEFYGGLRIGEVVNQTLGTINSKRGDSLTVEIKDNRAVLFPHLKDVSKESPKRLNYLETHLAQQTILDNELLWEVYDEHMKTLDLKLKRKEIKNPIALFLDIDGKAMSGNVYERRFKKVKVAMLKELESKPSRAEDYKLLSDSRWSTHIGRGIFTNFLFDMGLSITQIAIARGDRNIESALEYVDSKVTLHSLKNAMEEIKNIPVNKMGLIERDFILTHWKNGVLKRGR